MRDAPRARRLAGAGLELRALEWPGAAPTLLLVHATSFCAEAWEPVVAVGHSSGATACLAAAGLHPARFAAVVAVEPVLYDPSPAAQRGEADSFAGSRGLAAAARRRRDRFDSIEEARARLAARFPYRGFAPPALAAVLRGALRAEPDGAVALCCPGAREAACYAGAAALDPWPLIARLRAPLLLVLGEHSALPEPLRERLLAGRRDARTAVVPGATHFAALERPAEVGRALGRFAAALPAP